MTLGTLLRAPLGVDPLTIAGAFGAIAGAASLGVPYFNGLAEALAALAVVAWGVRLGSRSGRLPPMTAPVAVGVVVAWTFAVLAGPPLAEGRGAVLGAAAVALAWHARAISRSVEGTE
jgi:hypothetical protein